MKIYNTLSRVVEDFNLPKDHEIKIYSCGPTVYDYQHIGHMRRYVGDDILIRALKLNGYKVKHVMNITDVGHLTSDADTGEDKMEKGAEKLGLSVWDIAKKFEQQFFDSLETLNIRKPGTVMRATDYIKEQVELIEILEDKGFAYKTSDGIYFDSSKFPDYFKLSRQNPDDLIAGVRIEVGEKRNVSDFALWKFSPTDSKRQMEWESPWGKGFPGWHIECSAMSMKALGPTLDIHTGGVDHINIHHTNEIAQSESATGKPFVKYWIHHAFLRVEGEKMSKSLGNTYTVENIKEKGFEPLALRYLYLQTHYRQEMNFTWEALSGAQNALDKLKADIESWDEAKVGCAEFEQNFLEAVNNDLNMPEALAVLWEMVRSDYPSSAKKRSVLKFDEVLGLDLGKAKRKEEKIPDEIKKLSEKREELRKEGKFEEADKVRKEIEGKGFVIEDSESGPKLREKS